MSVENITPETLTFAHIKNWDGTTMKRFMASSQDMRDAIYRVAAEQATGQAQPVNDQIVETPPVVDPQVVPPSEVAPVPPVLPTPPVEAKKIVVEYQAKDENGNPIGRPTHLEAATEEDMRAKLIEAHVQATRAFHRLKGQKVQSLKEVNQQRPTPTVPAQVSEAELMNAIKDLKSDDPQKALEAHKKLVKAETDKVAAEKQVEFDKLNELRRQEQVSYKFLTDHQKDFNNCEANVKLIKDYFEDNQLPWTSDNLEVAYHALESELAPVAVQVARVVPANPAPTPTPTATPAAAAVAPTPTVTVPPTPPANPAPAQARPGVNGGLVPGQQSAPRPAGQPKGLTMEEIHSWDGPTMRAKMRNPQLRTEIERVVAEAKIRRGR